MNQRKVSQIGTVDWAKYFPIQPYIADNNRLADGIQQGVVKRGEVHLIPIDNNWGKEVHAVKLQQSKPELYAVSVIQTGGATNRDAKVRSDKHDINRHDQRFFVSLGDAPRDAHNKPHTRRLLQTMAAKSQQVSLPTQRVTLGFPRVNPDLWLSRCYMQCEFKRQESNFDSVVEGSNVTSFRSC